MHSACKLNKSRVTIYSLNILLSQFWTSPLFHVMFNAIIFHSLKFCLFIYFIFDCAGSSLLWSLFSSCGKQGLLSPCSALASHFSGFSCYRAQTLGYRSFISRGSRALEHNSCSAAGGIFPDRKSKPCLLQWQVDSLTLSDQGSPWWMNVRMSYAGLICPVLLLSWLLLKKDCRSTDCWTCLGENHLSST